MDTQQKTMITVGNTVNAPLAKTWECFTLPEHIVHWNFASDDWTCPKAENDLRAGGKFNYRMEAKDGSMGFGFWGTYDAVTTNQYIEYTMGDGRKANLTFLAKDGTTLVTENFEAEDENPHELQKGGWQAILDNFKKHTEGIE